MSDSNYCIEVEFIGPDKDNYPNSICYYPVLFDSVSRDELLERLEGKTGKAFAIQQVTLRDLNFKSLENIELLTKKHAEALKSKMEQKDKINVRVVSKHDLVSIIIKQDNERKKREYEERIEQQKQEDLRNYKNDIRYNH